MNAPLPRASLAAFRATIPTAPEPSPVATFRVRQRTMMTFVVDRRVTGPGTYPVEAGWFDCGTYQGEEAANAAAETAARRFSERNRGFATVVIPFPRTGRQPGRSYGALPGGDPNAEHRLGPADCLHGARGW